MQSLKVITAVKKQERRRNFAAASRTSNMSATTRFHGQRSINLLSTSENADLELSNKLSTKLVEDSSHAQTADTSLQNPVASKKSRKAKAALSSSQKPQERPRKAKGPLSSSRKPQKRPRKAKGPLSSSRKPHKRPRKHQSLDGSEQSQTQTAVELSLSDLPDSILTHWACQICSCSQGLFDYPVNSCIRCQHKMEEHEKVNRHWDPNCDHICERHDLVDSIMRLLEVMKVVVIRATPQSGKSTLLHLLGNYVVHQRTDLEPVYILWRNRAERNNIPYTTFLEENKSLWQGRNAEYRPCNPGAKTLYLIDEGQKSYDDIEFWARELKNPVVTRFRPMFVVVCLYGADVCVNRPPHVESLSLDINPVQRIELRPSRTSNPYILFTLKETTVVIQKWANFYRLELTDDIYEYIYRATDGHPGIVGLLLLHFNYFVSKSTEAARHARLWTPERCHDILIKHQELINHLAHFGRGFWTVKAEVNVKQYLASYCLDPRYRDIKFSDVVNTLRQVAIQPHGCTPAERSILLDFCHHVGYLYTQQAWPGSEQITYIFASPVHRRVAYRRLCPGPEPDSALENITLRQACLNAIERFSPSALQPRSMQSRDCRSVPEAAFQDEMYCALSYELHNLPILSEYSHTKDGRVDFFIFDKKWGIEILQCGSMSRIAEHATRFAAGGNYREWNIFADYIILNFCSKPNIQVIEVGDVEIRSRILQVVVDTKEYTAEVYTYDKQLLAMLTLGEGRQRFEGDKEPTPEDSPASTFWQDRATRLEQEKQKAEQETENLRRQLKQMQGL